MYSQSGFNLTESPRGVKNDFVGSYYLDFAGLTGTLQGGYTSEFTVIIADGSDMDRQHDRDALDEDVDFDIDDAIDDDSVEPEGIVIPGRNCTVTSIRSEFIFGAPQYQDAFVLEAYSDTTVDPDLATNAWIRATNMNLEAWLDDQVNTNLDELTGDVDIWWQFRAYLRWTLHWAIYVVPLKTGGSEAVNQDLEQANLDITGAIPQQGDEPTGPAVPMAGSWGLMSALGTNVGGSIHYPEAPEYPWARLWEQSNPPGIRRMIARGARVFPYGVRNIPGIVSSHQHYDFDVDDMEATPDPSGTQDQTPDVAFDGAQIRIKINRRFVHDLQDDEMVILHIQTGRARLSCPQWEDQDREVLTEPGLVIGGGALNAPVMGPPLTLTYARVTASSRTT